MPAWPGGPCPGCGEEMPAKLVHCQVCRMLLNDDLDPDSIEIPAFVPLKELSSMLDVEPTGYYMTCPHCEHELRLHRKYMGHRVQCKFCNGAVAAEESQATAFYTDCPHCQKELKNSMKYLGKKVACKYCEGHIQLVHGG